jgi:hypothetical protein
MGFHMHKYRFDCKMAQGHDHRILGYAGNMLGVGSLHFHFYYGVSSYRNHTHYFCGITGMTIKTENGHIHKMEGSLESNSLHTHEFSGYTFEDISAVSSTQAAGFTH